MFQPTWQAYQHITEKRKELMRDVENERLVKLIPSHSRQPTLYNRMLKWTGDRLILLGERLERSYQIGDDPMKDCVTC